MSFADISNIRILNQKIGSTEFKNPVEIVSWMGAIQAQDYSMAKWAIGVRLDNSTDKMIELSIDKGEIIRTHLLRPTWHFISAEDIYWMLDLTAPKIKLLLRSRDKDLELTEAIYTKTSSIIERALINENSLTRDELALEFTQAKINTDQNRLYHILLHAELDGIICSGQIKGSKQSYTLLQNRVPYKKTYTKDESLAMLAKRYFTSHGPATIHDFAWWSGLSVTEARQALEHVKAHFISETIGTETFWFRDISTNNKFNKSTIHFLPAFDEFLINYKSRKASVDLINHPKAVSDNGIFRPVIVVNGQITGLWKRTMKKDNLIIETNFFDTNNIPTKNLIKQNMLRYGMFMNKKVVVK